MTPGPPATDQRKVVPATPVDSRVTSPSIARAESLARLSPRPIPGWVRVWSSCACSSGSKIRGIASGSMPCPGRSPGPAGCRHRWRRGSRPASFPARTPTRSRPAPRGSGYRRSGSAPSSRARAGPRRGSGITRPDLLRELRHVGPLRQSRLDRRLEPADEPSETLGAEHQRVEDLIELLVVEPSTAKRLGEAQEDRHRGRSS
jgi:hypothetical protein